MDFNDEPSQQEVVPPVRRRRKRQAGLPDSFWNILSILVLFVLGAAILLFVSIYGNPNSQFNPFPPPTGAPSMLVATSVIIETATPQTPTLTQALPPTETVTSVPPTATETETPTPTETLTPGPTPTNTINAVYPFILRSDPVALASNAFPDHEECKLWVAGQVYEIQGAPLVGVTVVLGGGYQGKVISQYSLTGTALQYGPAGYEFTVADEAHASKRTLWVMLLDQAGVPLSNKIYFDTYEDCTKNLIVINFRQIR